MATKTSLNQRILDLIDEFGKPSTVDEFSVAMGVKKKSPKFASLKSSLSVLVKLGIMKKVKYPKKSTYYCKPEWVDKSGKVIQELNFNPYW